MISRYNVPEVATIWSQENRFKTYLKVELALIGALEKSHVKPGTAEKIRNKVCINEARINEIEAEVKHDIIAFCTSITEQLNEEEARYFHFGATSSDIIDTANNLLIKESLEIIIDDFKELLTTLHKRSVELKDTPCIGRSHGMNAEPMSFGLKLLNHYSELYRRFNEIKSFYNRDLTAQMSGAVGNYTILTSKIEEDVAYNLKLNVEPISSQIICRDRLSKLMGHFANYASALERICIEIRHLHHSNIAELNEGFSSGQKGSSTMPHKKNPISAENLSGIARVIRSHHQVALENNLLWHERDISHSSAERLYLPDSFGLVVYSLRRLKSTVEHLVFHPDQMLANIPQDESFYSSYVLHQLIQNTDYRREQLYRIVQDLAFESKEKNKSFIQLLESKIKNEKIPYQLNEQFGSNINETFLREVDNIFKRVEKEYPIT